MENETASLNLSSLFENAGTKAPWTKKLYKPYWSTPKFLIQSRLLPLACHCFQHQEIDWCRKTHVELVPWNHRIQTIQKHLKTALLEVLKVLTPLVACPIKGSDALLWEMGKQELMHTRDIDLMVRRSNLKEAQKRLYDMNFRQLAFVNQNSGKRQPATKEEILHHETTTYETWPWLKFIHLPELEDLVDLDRGGSIRTNRPGCSLSRVRYPLLVMERKVYLGLEIDLHHALWQNISTEELTFQEKAYGSLLLRRMAIEHQLVTLGLKFAKELNAGKVSALGTLWQLWYLMNRHGSPQLYEKCSDFAGRSGIIGPWISAVTFCRVLLNPIMNDPKKFPNAGNEATLKYAQRVLKNGGFGDWGLGSNGT